MNKQSYNEGCAQIKYWKGEPSWSKTIYVLGLPRSGKSTIFNVLASCNHVEALDEPFDLIGIAQKASDCIAESNTYFQYQDLYAACMENYFSELVLGRSYNLRKQDKSCVYNYKTSEYVANAHARSRRLDVLSYAKSVETSFLIALNDVESSIEFIASNVPNVEFVHIKRNVIDIAHDIAEKNWLSDEQLSTQTNLAPAFNTVLQHGSVKIYVPYLISPEHAQLFLSLDVFERSLMYAILQDRKLMLEMSKINYSCHQINFEEMIQRPLEAMDELIRKFNLSKTVLTNKNIKLIEDANIKDSSESFDELDISHRLKEFLNESLGETI